MNIMKNTKKVLYIILGVALLIVLIFGLSKVIGTRVDYANMPLQEILKLPADQKDSALNAQKIALEKKARKLSKKATADEKYAVYIKLAEAQLELKQFNDALSSLNSIPAEKQDNSRTQSAFIEAYMGAGDRTNAQATSTKALETYKEDAEVWTAYLWAYDDLPKDQLNLLYKDAIAKTKSALPVMISYAKFSEKIGDIATAVAAWETAINHDPANEAKYLEEIHRLRP